MWLNGTTSAWRRQHDPVVKILLERVAELPSPERAVLFSIVSAAAALVNRLVGPTQGARRILRVKPRDLKEREFFHLYFVASAALLAVFIRQAEITDPTPLENSFAHLFHHFPDRDEFYCEFSSRFAEGGASPFLYQLRELKRLLPYRRTELGDFTHQPGEFIEAMGEAIEAMSQLVKLNLQAARIPFPAV
jgi:hypothetical protein